MWSEDYNLGKNKTIFFKQGPSDKKKKKKASFAKKKRKVNSVENTRWTYFLIEWLPKLP